MLNEKLNYGIVYIALCTHNTGFNAITLEFKHKLCLFCMLKHPYFLCCDADAYEQV